MNCLSNLFCRKIGSYNMAVSKLLLHKVDGKKQVFVETTRSPFK